MKYRTTNLDKDSFLKFYYLSEYLFKNNLHENLGNKSHSILYLIQLFIKQYKINNDDEIKNKIKSYKLKGNNLNSITYQIDDEMELEFDLIRKDLNNPVKNKIISMLIDDFYKVETSKLSELDFINAIDYIKTKITYETENEFIIGIFPQEIIDYVLSDNELFHVEDLINNRIISHKVYGGIDNLKFICFNLYKMRYALESSMGEICKCFNRDTRTIERFMGMFDWNMDLFEAQQRASKRRDYKHIINKGKETMMKNGTRQISSTEEYCREKINLVLTSLLHDYEFIVGVANMGILDDGKEIDIPIIVFKDNSVYRFAIEVNGTHWHTNKERDNIKECMINNKGYTLFSIIQTKATKGKTYYNNLDIQIMEICNKIKLSL